MNIYNSGSVSLLQGYHDEITPLAGRTFLRHTPEKTYLITKSPPSPGCYVLLIKGANGVDDVQEELIRKDEDGNFYVLDNEYVRARYKNISILVSRLRQAGFIGEPFVFKTLEKQHIIPGRKHGRRAIVFDWDWTLSPYHYCSPHPGYAKLKNDTLIVRGLEEKTLADAFGGHERVQKFKELFEKMDTDFDLYIITFGYQDLVRTYCELLFGKQYFTQVIGNEGSNRNSMGMHTNKQSLLMELKNNYYNQVDFWDDTYEEIVLARMNGINAHLASENRRRDGKAGLTPEEISNIIYPPEPKTYAQAVVLNKE